MTKLLIVEDEHPILRGYQDYFTRQGYVVDVAHDGEEGLGKAEHFVPDLILLDILMPKMDGLTMLKKLRALPRFKETPVIVLTNLDTSESIGKAVEQGTTHYLLKNNYGLEELDQKIRSVLKT